MASLGGSRENTHAHVCTHAHTNTPEHPTQSSHSAPSFIPLTLVETDGRVQRVDPEMQQLACDQVFSDL